MVGTPMVAKVHGAATPTLVDTSPEASLGGSLQPLGLCRVLLFLALYCCGLTCCFFVNKLHGNGYLPPLTEQVTESLEVVVDKLPVDA